ncbi:hypothetical protein DL98DRAFT_525825 [Cadophora sp. DSE1049]|nr:hypothetical protein DL98DRAFT_525825 [Cadophora sp. DSE1049]
MASPSTASPIEPGIFNARGMTVDTRLQVFNAVFHVHSPILKLYSQYFATYLDSADKAKSTASSGPGAATAFQYEWVTKVLDGGSDWQLVCAGPNTARFYMALPVVSRSLQRVLCDSTDFIADEIRGNPCKMLCAAAELKCADIFDDAMIWSLGPFSDPMYKTLEDPKLKEIAHNLYCRLSADVHRIHYDLIEETVNDNGSADEVLAILKKQMTIGREIKDSHAGKLLMPKLVRDLYNDIKLGGGLESTKELLQDKLESLLYNELCLGMMMNAQPGNEDDGCEDYFLLHCVWWGSHPWDSTELDW